MKKNEYTSSDILATLLTVITVDCYNLKDPALIVVPWYIKIALKGI